MAKLQQEHAATEERCRLMRDLYDGLGSQLFILPSRVEHRAMQTPELSQSLRACIADMLLSLDALATDDANLETALADFLYRWRPLLSEPVTWMSARPALQLLRLPQEALTNVIKHANAQKIRVEVIATHELLVITVIDKGKWFRSTPRRQADAGFSICAHVRRP